VTKLTYTAYYSGFKASIATTSDTLFKQFHHSQCVGDQICLCALLAVFTTVSEWVRQYFGIQYHTIWQKGTDVTCWVHIQASLHSSTMKTDEADPSRKLVLVYQTVHITLQKTKIHLSPSSGNYVPDNHYHIISYNFLIRDRPMMSPKWTSI